MTELISRNVAANVLHFFRGDEAYSGGSFSDALLSAAGNADRDNLDRLALGFPAEIAAYRLVVDHSDGLNRLRANFLGVSA